MYIPGFLPFCAAPAKSAPLLPAVLACSRAGKVVLMYAPPVTRLAFLWSSSGLTRGSRIKWITRSKPVPDSDPGSGNDGEGRPEDDQRKRQSRAPGSAAASIPVVQNNRRRQKKGAPHASILSPPPDRSPSPGAVTGLAACRFSLCYCPRPAFVMIRKTEASGTDDETRHPLHFGGAYTRSLFLF